MSVRRGGSACSIKPRLLLAMTVLVMLACDSGNGTTELLGIPGLPGPATSISITPSELALGASEKRPLIALATDAAGRATPATFTWSSANPAIATVGTTDGIVTGIASGGTLITVTTGTVAATAHVIVVGGTIAMTRWTSDWTSGTGVIAVDALVYPGADGMPRALPLPGAFLAIAAPAWSTDGMLLALEGVSSPILENDDHIVVYQGDIIVLDPAASTWRVLTTGGRGRMPSWSPDGSRLAYLGGSDSGNHIYTISASGGSPTRLASTGGVHSAPQWSPDGLRLTFAMDGDVHVVNADGTGLTNVTRSTAYDFDPSWSPDGARVVFASAGGGKQEVFSVALADPDRPVLLTNAIYGGSPESPKWSPDGGQIAFTLQTGIADRSGIYVMNADGSFPAQLVKALPNSYANVSSWTR